MDEVIRMKITHGEYIFVKVYRFDLKNYSGLRR